MKNNSKESSNIPIRFANTVFVLGVLFCVFIALYAVYKINNYPQRSLTFYYTFILLSLFAAILLGFGLRLLRDEFKVNLSVLFMAISISVYGFEIYLDLSRTLVKKKEIVIPKNKLESREQIAQNMGVPYDTRTKIEVIEDLIVSGIKAYPNIHPAYLLDNLSTQNGLPARGSKLFPLGGISNKVMVQENESGYWMMYKGDKFGFHNHNGVYQNSQIDIVMTGDSYVEGWCVNSEENISSVLQELGFNVVNIAKSGNGPLLEYAALKEYAKPLKPKIILWVYFMNDLSDLNRELRSSQLKKYLNEDAFSQNLISRQDEIDSVLINYVNQEYDKQVRRDSEEVIQITSNLAIKDIVNSTETDNSIGVDEIQIEKNVNHWLTRVFKLANIRTKISLILKPKPKEVFKNILEKSKQMVTGWGGEIYFVYLPSYYYQTLHTEISNMFVNEEKNREIVIRTAIELDIPIIDIHKEVFEHHQDPLSLFPFRILGHYNTEGYRLVAKAIGKRLKADGVISIN